MKMHLRLAIAVVGSATAAHAREGYCLNTYDCGVSECAPGANKVYNDEMCVCGILLGRQFPESEWKVDYCRASRCKSVYDHCCNKRFLACVHSGLSAEELRFEDVWEEHVTNVPGKDFRVVNYCRNIKCPQDINDLNVSGLEQCLPNTTIEGVYFEFNKMSSLKEFRTCDDQCKGIPLKTQEEYDCTTDCYNQINPNKFRLTAATQPEWDEMFDLHIEPF